jgi:hypothetical protein
MRHPPTDWHICPSCGTEFGYEDIGRTYQELRMQWLNSGMQWWSSATKAPENWDPVLQLVTGVFANPATAVFSAKVDPMVTGFALTGSVKKKGVKRRGFSRPIGQLAWDGTFGTAAA